MKPVKFSGTFHISSDYEPQTARKFSRKINLPKLNQERGQSVSARVVKPSKENVKILSLPGSSTRNAAKLGFMGQVRSTPEFSSSEAETQVNHAAAQSG